MSSVKAQTPERRKPVRRDWTREREEQQRLDREEEEEEERERERDLVSAGISIDPLKAGRKEGRGGERSASSPSFDERADLPRPLSFLISRLAAEESTAISSTRLPSLFISLPSKSPRTLLLLSIPTKPSFDFNSSSSSLSTSTLPSSYTSSSPSLPTKDHQTQSSLLSTQRIHLRSPSRHDGRSTRRDSSTSQSSRPTSTSLNPTSQLLFLPPRPYPHVHSGTSLRFGRPTHPPLSFQQLPLLNPSFNDLHRRSHRPLQRPLLRSSSFLLNQTSSSTQTSSFSSSPLLETQDSLPSRSSTSSGTDPTPLGDVEGVDCCSSEIARWRGTIA